MTTITHDLAQEVCENFCYTRFQIVDKIHILTSKLLLIMKSFKYCMEEEAVGWVAVADLGFKYRVCRAKIFTYKTV